jgi:gluconolactonase
VLAYPEARLSHREDFRRIRDGKDRSANGTSPSVGRVELAPFEFLDRLADLVPPTRKHRHRYHGVFAPNHPLRPAVTVLAVGTQLTSRSSAWEPIAEVPLAGLFFDTEPCFSRSAQIVVCEMRRLTWLILPAIGLVLSAGRSSAHDAIAGLGPIGPVTVVHSGFTFTEGPAADRNGNLYFSDIPANRIHKVDASGAVSTFREGSNAANGLIVNAAGEIVACEGKGQVVAISADGKDRRVLVERHDGARFNAPNDLVLDKAGGVYFTDPYFGAPSPLPQKVQAVYYADKTGKATRLVDDLRSPNGIILSPDEKTLYVVPYDQAEVMAYPIESPGQIGAGRVFCTLEQPQGQVGRGGDGLTVDERGNLYITSPTGLQVYSPDGKLLGTIKVPGTLTNATFGGPDGKTLYITGGPNVYAAPMSVKGHVFPAR